MVTPSQLGFSDDTSPSSPSLSRRNPPRKHALKAKKTTKRLASPVSNRIWNEEDELTVLKGFVDYRAKTGLEPNSDWIAFYRFLGGYIAEKYSEEQVASKIRKLKRKLLVHMERTDGGNDTVYTNSEIFALSRMIWGQNEPELVNRSESDNQEETLKEDEQMANPEPLKENVAEKTDFDGNGTDADESCAVRDAFEAMISQGLSDYQKKLQLEKLMNIGSGKRKELSNEWKALCGEEVKLNVKKLRFYAKLAEAATDR